MTDSTTIRNELTDTHQHLDALDVQIREHQDAGRYREIGALREERTAVGAQLPALEAELAAAEVAERNLAKARKVPEFVATNQDARAQLRAALEPFTEAVENLAKAAHFQKQTAQFCSGAIRELGEETAVRDGSGGWVRFENEGKFLATEIAAVLSPLLYSLGEQSLGDQLRNRVRAGNRMLPS